MKTIRLIFIIVLVSSVWFGCTDEDPADVPEITSITPADGSLQVARGTEISVSFSNSMDISECQSRFGLFHGELEQIPEDFSSSVTGAFSWNDNNTIMTFYPDSSLDANTMYSICLKEGMLMEHEHSSMMDSDHGHSNDMMTGDMHISGLKVSGGMIIKFTTE